MSLGAPAGRAFEDRVEYELLRRGWEAATGTYSAELGLHLGSLWSFIRKTQLEPWSKLLELYGGDEDAAKQQFALRVAREIDSRGVLDVLRLGVRDRGVRIDLAYFRSERTRASRAPAEDDANILGVARQLQFSQRDPSQSVDMALFVNGLPVATVELGNPNTGQVALDAIARYRQRDPKDLFFARRTLVHLAVDPDRAFITTRLKGPNTRFAPFNVGSAGPGKDGGAGNQRGVRDDYPVSYLWHEIWQRENWLEILQGFIHIVPANAKNEEVDPHSSTPVFPRFHQWHAVQQAVTHVREHGAGSSYLFQHSEGSGKSNTIAWLTYGLSSLFYDDDQPVFHKVIVITDRVALGQRLQQAISQLDHLPGVVNKVDDSSQLADALSDTTSKIIVSTQQKYAFVLDKIAGAGLNRQRYAVIIDEAHSSQGGDGTARLRQALGANAAPAQDGEDLLEYYTRVRGRQPNQSYFAFTATPTPKTFRLFGTFDPDKVDPRSGKPGCYLPFHVYSMRQAIEEGYILDVLANYITYDETWRLRNLAVDQQQSQSADPEMDERSAARKLVRFPELHPTAIGQKAKLIVDDFRIGVAARLGGRAKAMVVTSSRQHALDLYQAIRKYNDETKDVPGNADCAPLVAFSGMLTDEKLRIQFPESTVNGFPEWELPGRFGYVRLDDHLGGVRQRNEHRILVVAEKYATTLDQPLLSGMYVDKPLTGAAAVQTLSRLNRIHPLKSQDDVRVLDFVNTPGDIAAAFAPWYKTTITEPTDPNVLYDRLRAVMAFGLLVESEMESFIRVLNDSGPGRLPDLQPALDRFAALDTGDEREEFQAALQGYVRLYTRIAQIVDWGDRDLERLYEYGRELLIRLPGRPAASVDTGDADQDTRLNEEGDNIRSLVAAGDYLQAEERLMHLAAENPQQAEPFLLELGFITLPDPDRRLIATAWSVTAMGHSVQSLLAGADGVSSPDGPQRKAGGSALLASGAGAPLQPQVVATSRPRRSAQQSGAALEQATVDLFARFFAADPEVIKSRLRRQGAGTQFGHDIELECSVAGSPAVRCHVECKNLDRMVTLDDIAGKLAQQKIHQRDVQIDHWILISPHHDVSNDLRVTLDTWDQLGEYPFSVQVWSPESRVREMFALEPAVYRELYGRPPTPDEIAASAETAELIRRRLAPRLRVAPVWWRYLEQPDAFCFVTENSRHFDGLYGRHLPLKAADERGARLDGTLMDEVIGWADDGAAAPMLLLADFGEGKSVFTYCLTRRLSEEFRAAPDGALFPLRIPLREFREAGSARSLLERRLNEVGATVADWRALTRQVRTLAILDGFDEMSADLSPPAITANLRDIRSCLTELSGSKILVTSRQRVLDGSRDWRRTMDRLGGPRVMRIASGSRRQRVQYLEQFVTDESSARVLANLRSLYDPIGLAAKPLFLEMIKETLRDLPDDTFSETILYDTYIKKSLQAKWELLADLTEDLTSDELTENLEEILEDVAVRVQEANGAYLYLRDYQDEERGKIAELLWKMRDQAVPREPFTVAAQDDAANRVGIRSLLKAVAAPYAERWPVDFFHRSMREYFVARSIVRSLTTDIKRTRQILSAAPLLPEIAHFAATILRSRHDAALTALERLARSATTDCGEAYLGGNALTLFHGAAGLLAGRDWSGLHLDHARLQGADLRGASFTGSSLRYTNLNNANLENADLTGADLEGVRLEETSQVLAVTALEGNRVVAAYEDRSLREWHLRPGGGWESRVVATLDHKADGLQVTPLGRVMASGEGMLSVLDVAGGPASSSDPAESAGSASPSEAGEVSSVRCAFRTNSRSRAAVLGVRTALFTEEGDGGQILATWLDMATARTLEEIDEDDAVTGLHPAGQCPVRARDLRRNLCRLASRGRPFPGGDRRRSCRYLPSRARSRRWSSARRRAPGRLGEPNPT